MNFTLKPFQVSAVEHALKIFETHCAHLLSAGTGVGKTVISCAVAKEYVKRFEGSAIHALASPRILVITPKSVKNQFALDAKTFFGLDKTPAIEIISPGELRTSKGRKYLTLVPNEEANRDVGRVDRYTWSAVNPPLFVIIDECQWTNNIGTQQHEIMMEALCMADAAPMYLAIDPTKATGTKFLFMSATPASKAAHLDVIVRARCLDGDKPLYDKDTRALVKQSLSFKSVPKKHLVGRMLLQGIAGGADPFAVDDKAMGRVSHFLNDITHRVPAIRFAHKNVLQVATTRPPLRLRRTLTRR